MKEKEKKDEKEGIKMYDDELKEHVLHIVDMLKDGTEFYLNQIVFHPQASFGRMFFAEVDAERVPNVTCISGKNEKAKYKKLKEKKA